MPNRQRTPINAALRAFASAADEIPEQEWWLGWAQNSEDNELA